MSKFPSPPPHAVSTESGNTSDTFDDPSTFFDEIVSLGHFIESQIAKAAKQSGIEIPVTRYPITISYDYPNLSKLKGKCFDDD